MSSLEAGRSPRQGLDDLSVSSLPEADLRVVFEQAPAGIALLDLTGRVVHGNAALGCLLGRDPAALAGCCLRDLVVPGDRGVVDAHWRTLQDDGEVRLACRLATPLGAAVWVDLTARRVAAPGADGVVLHVQDARKRKEVETELRRQALHDALTRLPNRALLLDRCVHALAAAARDGRPVTLLFLDLDGFKAVNDAHGHVAGDRLLQLLALRITGVLRPGDSAARLGGDEFVVLCPDTSSEQAEAVAARLQAAVEVPFDLDGARVRVTAAVGSATATPTGPDDEPPADALALLARADLAMYRAKRGRSRAATP